MKLEVGMWVRGKGYVCRITEVGSDWVKTDKKIFTMNYDQRYDYEFMSLGFESIESASHNIVDVLKSDDYANGNRIIEVFDIGVDTHNGFINANEIKSVLTKEQYEQYATKVEQKSALEENNYSFETGV